MPSGHVKNAPYHQHHGDKQSKHIFGNGYVPRPIFLAIDNLHDLPLVLAVGSSHPESGVAVDICASMLHLRRHEAVQSVVPPQYDGQRDRLVVTEGHLPAIPVAKMLEDDLLRVDLALLFTAMSLSRHAWQCPQDEYGRQYDGQKLLHDQ